MKIKMLEMYVANCDCDDSYSSSSFYYPHDCTDWDEVTEEDLNYLKKWVQNQNNNIRRCYQSDPYTKYIIITESQVSAKQIVKDYLEKAKKEIQEKEEKERKKKEKLEKRNKTLSDKKKKEEMALLEELKAKYE